MKTREPVAVTSRPMTIRELLDVADGARIELSPEAAVDQLFLGLRRYLKKSGRVRSD